VYYLLGLIPTLSVLVKQISNSMNMAARAARTVHGKMQKLAAILVTATTRTHRSRWEKVARAGRPPWDVRNEKIANFIPAGSSVIDLGCGAQTLKSHLRAGCKYQPCDLVKSTPDVIVRDFNAGQYPKSHERFTHVVCSGVLEYIRDPRRFLEEACSLGDSLILSYNPFPCQGSKLLRMTNNWINHFTEADLERTFNELGLTAKVLHRAEHGELIFLLQAACHEGLPEEDRMRNAAGGPNSRAVARPSGRSSDSAPPPAAS
jgi:hypothetical protein